MTLEQEKEAWLWSASKLSILFEKLYYVFKEVIEQNNIQLTKIFDEIDFSNEKYQLFNELIKLFKLLNFMCYQFLSAILAIMKLSTRKGPLIAFDNYIILYI